MRHLVTIIDWYGPYSFEEAVKAAKEEFDNGLYLCLGKTKSQHGATKLQYVGIAGESLSTRINESHQKLTLVTRDRVIWLGEVGTMGVPGIKKKKTDRALDLAEWALVYFLQPPLNNKKKKKPPELPVSVLNRWWRKDFETPWIKRPHPELPEFIDYLGRNYPAKIVWFKKIKRVAIPS
jgi:hypothetical protein